LVNYPYGYIIHPSGNSVNLEFHFEDGGCYMTSGRLVSLLFCIKEPIEVILIYLYKENGFKLRYIKQKDATGVYSGVESKDIIEISSPKSDDDLDIRNVNCEPTADTYILHQYDDDRVFGWSLKVSEAYASQRKDQVLVS
jgi:hypothetical protein